MAAETQYTANTGMVVISTANSNVDGSGALGTVLTAGSNGTLIKSITIKAQGNTSEGMVRLYIGSGASSYMVAEVAVPAVTKSSQVSSFETYLETAYSLQAGDILKASTQNGETFNVIAEGLDWAYYTTSVRPESTKYTANTGLAVISTANSNLDGTGTLGTVLTAASNGTNIQSITIKATVSTTAGMIRLFITGGGATNLLLEVPVPAVTKSSNAHSFSHRVLFNGNDFALKSGYILKASTQNAESFNVIAEALDWTYPA